MGDSSINTRLKKNIPWKLVLVFLLFSAAIVLVGIYYYEFQKDKIFTEQENNLSAIAALKINQILSWHNERIEDATVISNDKPLIRSVENFFNGGNKDNKSEVSDWMKSVRNEYDYLNVLIADTSYKVRLSVNSSDYFLGDSIKEEMEKALKGHSIILTDLHRSKEIPLIHLDILIPLIDSVNKKQITVGLAILRIDPYKVLFPLVQSWPTSSKSSETLLLRKERDSVIYLNELRHLKNAALRLKMPLTNKTLLATKAVYGLEGLTEGTDYRNIPVVGSVHKIPETSWYLVAKVDKEEILSPLKRYVFQIILIVVLLVLINASIFGFWIWEQRLRMYRLQLKDEMAIRESEERFTTAFMMSPVSVTISSLTDNRFIDVNNTFLKDMEYMREEVMGRTPRELNIWADENERLWIINEIKEKGRIFGKVISYQSKTGKIIYGLSSMSVVKVNGETCNLSTVVNITESKNAELKLIESEELFRKLFENMLNGFAYCKMICEEGKPLDFMYLNVNEAFSTLTGLKDVVGKRASEAIPGIQASDPKLLERYSRVALTGKPEVFETYVEALKMWFAISVYCPQKGYFVAVFDVITARKIAEEKLQETNEYLSNLFNYANAPIITWDTSLLITRFNHAFEELSGYSAEEVIGRKISILFPKDETKSSLSLINEAVKGEPWETVKIEIKRKDGDSRMVLWNSANIHDKDGKTVIATIAQGYDITERQKIEQTLIESEVKFRKAFFTNPDPVTITHLDNGTYVSVNDGFTKTFEYSEEEVIGKTPFDISIWHNVDERKLFINALKAEGEVRNFETKFYTKSRRLIDCLITATTISLEGVDHVLSNTRDITYRKNAELALLDSEERFRSLYENATMGIYRTTLDGKILMANPALVKMLGFSSFEDLAHRNLQEEGYEPDYPRAKFIETLEKEDKIIGLESAWYQRDGNTLYVRESASVIRDAEGTILYYDGNIEDITYRKQAEEALRESEERFSKSFKTSPISFMIATMEDGRIMEVNDAFTTVSGYTREESVNFTTLNLKIWVNELDRVHIMDSLRNGKAILHKETLLRAKNGNVLIVLLSAQVIKIGNRNCIISSIEDITKRKEVEDELRVQSEIMSHMAEAVYLVRMEDGIIVYANTRFEELFGYGPGEMTGKPVAIINAATKKSPEETANEIMSDLRKNGFWTGEVLNIKKNGTVFWSHANVAIFDHSNFGKVLVSVQQDITDRKNAELQIKRLNEELEERVIQRTELLEAANKELEAFSYSVSHDLRAPLRSVHGFTKILLEDYEANLDEEGKRICGIISSSATQMGELIDDLLSFSRIGRSSLNPSEIDMKKMAKVVFEGMTSPTERKRIKLNIGKLQKAFGDITLFGQVWTNLISNAIKYSSKIDVSEINIGSESDGKMITYFVKDNGVGFDKNYKHKLFSVFQRLHSEAEFEGNGVGLAIVQRIILKHGGKVWAEGEVGKGATFYFSLPVHEINKETHDAGRRTHGKH